MIASSEGWIAIAGTAAVLGFAPRALARQAAGLAPAARTHALLAAALFVAGGAASLAAPSGPAAGVVAMALCGAAYFDLRYLVIPDLYSATIGLVAAWWGIHGDLAWPAILAGAGGAGGMLAVVRAMRRAPDGSPGMGLGDVKLAAAIGAGLGLTVALWVICLSAALGAAWALARHGRAPAPAAALVLTPYGAFLALTALGAGLIRW